MKTMCPSADDAMARWWGERCRAAASPGAIRALNEMNSLIDVRSLLPAIRVPTLVINRGTDYDVRSRRAATSPSASAMPASSSCREPTTSSASTPIRSSTPSSRSSPNREPRESRPTVIACWSRSSRPRPPAHRRFASAARDRARELARYRGRELEAARDRILASFDGPARAVRYATAITDAVARSASRPAPACTPARSRSPMAGPWRRPRHRRRCGRRGRLRRGARVADRHGPRRRLRARVRRSREPGASGVPGDRRLLAVVDPDRDRRRPGAPMIGRAEELERLERALRRAESGPGQRCWSRARPGSARPGS